MAKKRYAIVGASHRSLNMFVRPVQRVLKRHGPLPDARTPRDKECVQRQIGEEATT